MTVPRLSSPPPSPVTVPPVIVSPEIDAVTLALTWNTRLAWLPLTVTPAAGPVIVCVPVVLLSAELGAAQGDRLGGGEHGAGQR